MANWCNYYMKVVGKDENCEKFFDILNYRSNRNFDRVYEAINQRAYTDNGMSVLEISGYCAWSVASSMCSCDKDHVTSLIAETDRLKLDIEVYSTEPGCYFAEHYRFKNGKQLIDECVDYDEFYWDRNDFPTIEELNAEYGTNYTENDFDENGYHIEGGFGDWSFAA